MFSRINIIIIEKKKILISITYTKIITIHTCNDEMENITRRIGIEIGHQINLDTMVTE